MPEAVFVVFPFFAPTRLLTIPTCIMFGQVQPASNVPRATTAITEPCKLDACTINQVWNGNDSCPQTHFDFEPHEALLVFPVEADTEHGHRMLEAALVEDVSSEALGGRSGYAEKMIARRLPDA